MAPITVPRRKMPSFAMNRARAVIFLAKWITIHLGICAAGFDVLLGVRPHDTPARENCMYVDVNAIAEVSRPRRCTMKPFLSARGTRP